jgi:hypothetical protein
MTDPTAPVTPRTKAGRETLADPYFAPPGTPFYDALKVRILAIEREAGGTDALRAALERLVAEYDDDPIRPASWISMKQARAALAASDAGPAGIDVERLASGIAYALARADLPMGEDTSRDYAERLAPLVLESGWLYTRLARESDR